VQWFADNAGVDGTNLGRFVRGRRKPGQTMLSKLEVLLAQDSKVLSHHKDNSS
jgi:hypothetical protein